MARRNNILLLMENYGHISAEEKEAAAAEKIVVQEEKSSFRGYYADAVIREAAVELGVSADDILKGGYRIYTSLDASLQKKCESLFDEERLFPTKDCEGALVILDVKTGEVAALMGGREQNAAMSFNRAVNIKRQPGSVMKPIISFAPAIELCGYTAASMLLDEPTSFSEYAPRNYNDRYYGWVTMREAIRRSLNVPAVKLLNEIGIENGKAFAESLGIMFHESDSSLTLALGGFTYGVSPLDIAGAYGAFASGGIYREPSMIRRINNASGEQIYLHKSESKRVMREENAFILTNMLQSAIESGTGRRLGEINIPLAGKTGTVGTEDGNRDAWMSAYNSEYAACVWMGYDSDEQGVLPPDATGGTYPALILKEVFSFLYESADHAPSFAEPENIIRCDLDAYTLQAEHRAVLANSFTPKDERISEFFANGTEPTVVTEYWSIPYPVKNLTVKYSALQFPVISFYAPQEYIQYCLYRETLDSGEKKLVHQWNATKGTVSFTDRSITNGKSYRYYVLPQHPKIIVNGNNVKGPVRQSSIIDIWSAELILEDTEIEMLIP